MGEFNPARNIGKIVMGLVDTVLEIDAMIEDIIFLWVCWSHFKSGERESAFLGPLLKKRELGGSWFINEACIPYKRLLGTSGVMQFQSKPRHSKFRRMEEWCPQYEQVLAV